jgi:hypothetical protein
MKQFTNFRCRPVSIKLKMFLKGIFRLLLKSDDDDDDDKCNVASLGVLYAWHLPCSPFPVAYCDV